MNIINILRIHIRSLLLYRFIINNKTAICYHTD
nr:MAG TPA: hypothetical protein [Bacteriophage sp.]